MLALTGGRLLLSQDMVATRLRKLLVTRGYLRPRIRLMMNDALGGKMLITSDGPVSNVLGPLLSGKVFRSIYRLRMFHLNE